MTDHLLYIGSTGRVGTQFCNMAADRFNITGIGRRDASTTANIDYVQANVVKCNWDYVMPIVESKHGAPKHVVYSVMTPMPRPPINAIPESLTKEIFDAHVFGLMRTVTKLTNVWQGKEEGCSITIVSSMGSFISDRPELVTYCAAKAAQNSIGLTLATALPNIRINVLCPPALPNSAAHKRVAEEILAVVEGTETGQLIKVTL